ncbi:hypothetical protein [Methylocapsa palsarum]|uniref:MxaH protein n=1 Tax=Methylocapsa palsarum TaxID=1612308 RepID=A0A1I4AZT6_9HYPH|nr:hypothetical protein [Methylocapsa palsarum]SFK61189.1 hypothetical protein SAMN05444581_11224 [Methylocapsa palsarum]
MTHWIIRPALLAGFCLTLFAACDKREPSKDATSSDHVEVQDKNRSNWLRISDQVDPAAWLVSKEMRREVAANDPAVLEMRQALALAETRFLESDRMLANRTAQVSETLSSEGRPLSSLTLLASLTMIVPETSQKQTYGDLCQFYLNLRHAGVDHDGALAFLSKRFTPERLK